MLKKLSKKWLIVICVAVAAVLILSIIIMVVALKSDADRLVYNLKDDGTYEVVDIKDTYRGGVFAKGSITIPAEYNGKPVSTVATLKLNSTDEVILSDGIKTIGANAFYGSNFSKITIPESVTEIGMYAFSDCVNLKEIVIPNRVVTIESGTFNGCRTLASVSIPASVISIGSNAFTNCYALDQLTLPNSLMYIESNVFNGCNSLKTLNIPDSVKSIGKNAFNGSALENISLPSGLTTIAEGAFRNCVALTTLDIPSSVTAIEKNAFNGSAIENIVLPDGLAKIAEGTFQDCAALQALNIPDSVTEIEANAFANCTSIKALNIPAEVKTIGDGAFSGCSELESLVLPDGLTTIGIKDVIKGCDKLPLHTENGQKYLGTAANPYLMLVEATEVGTSTTYAVKEETHFIYTGALSGLQNIVEIDIPATFVNLSTTDLSSMTKLETIVVAAANANYSSLDGTLFNKELTEILAIPTAAKSLTIPEAMVTFNARNLRLSNYKQLTGVTFQVTTGWRAGATNIDATELSDPVKALEKLKSGNTAGATWRRTVTE